MSLYKVISNRKLTDAVWEIVLAGDTAAFTRAGQFAQVKIEPYFLRRPISLCDADNGTMTLVYKTVGAGTDALTRVSDSLDVLTGLGNGFDTDVPEREILVIGGGVGIPPLYLLTKKLIASGKQPTVILGFNTEKEIFYLDRFRALGASVKLVTADGSAGEKGLVTDVQPEGGYVFACGPIPMLKAVSEKCRSGQFSFEERMGCGFGACMGCTHRTVNGYKRICKDGPVLVKEEILWTQE